MNESFRLLFSGDGETWGMVARSIHFSILSTFFALLPGVPIGIVLALGKFPGRKLAVAIFNALMAIPTVVIGLAVYSLISRSGPLGSKGWLFAPAGIIFGQIFLAFPVVTSLTYTGLSKIDNRFHETLITFGTKPFLRLILTLREAQSVLIATIVAAFGRVIGEVGISMMLGGNIRHLTRTMTTAIALDAAKGEFEQALSLGIVLLTIALLVSITLHFLNDSGT